MPEPLLGESITDLDGTEAGELEVDVTGLSRRPGDLWTGELEVEWRALTRLGLSLEAGAAHQGAGSGVATSLRPSASFVLFHDPVRDLHLMLDASVRLLENDSEAEPGEPAFAACVFVARRDTTRAAYAPRRARRWCRRTQRPHGAASGAGRGAARGSVWLLGDRGGRRFRALLAVGASSGACARNPGFARGCGDALGIGRRPAWSFRATDLRGRSGIASVKALKG